MANFTMLIVAGAATIAACAISPAPSTTDAGPRDASLVDTPALDAAATAADGADAIVDSSPVIWQSQQALPFGRYGHGAVSAGGRVYVLGGDRGGNVQVADVVVASIGAGGTGAWTATTPLPAPRFELEATYVNGFIYAIAGANQVGQLGDVVYAPVLPGGHLGAWATTATLSPPRASFAVATLDNCIFAVGGNYGLAGINLTDVSVAHAAANGTLSAWTSTSPLPAPRTVHAAIAVRDGATAWLVVTGGGITGQPANDHVLRATIHPDCSLGSWSELTPMPQVRWTHEMAEFGDRLYVLAGSEGNTPIPRVLQGPLDGSGPWLDAPPLPTPHFDGAPATTADTLCTIGGRGPGPGDIYAEVQCLNVARTVP